MSLLSLQSLSLSFPPHTSPVVHNVSLTLHPRQTLAIVGESGSGKSLTALSLLQLLPRHARIDSGRALLYPVPPVSDRPASSSSNAPGSPALAGTAIPGASLAHSRPFAPSSASQQPLDLLTLPPHQIRSIRGSQIAMIFQEPMTSLNPVFSIGDQITEAIRLHTHPRVSPRQAREIAAAALADVGITDPAARLKQYPHQFSGGMRQRVMIAMALACRPRILLADEATTALDTTIQAQILQLLRDLQARTGLGIILITHALGVVAQNADVVAVMYNGRIVEYATVLDLFAHPLHPYTRGLLASIPILGHPRDRLLTIRQVTDDPRQFDRIGDTPNVKPWWPHHTPPADLAPLQPQQPQPPRQNQPIAPALPSDSILIQPEPNHWVAAWCTAAALSVPSPHPDLAFRLTPANAADSRQFPAPPAA